MAHNLFTIESNFPNVTHDWGDFIHELKQLPHYNCLGKFNDTVAERAAYIRNGFTDVVLLGTGGSSLGGQAITALQNSDAPRLHFMDNIDPHSYAKLFARLDLEKTAVVATSKSGSTMETMAQLLWCLKQFKGPAIAQHFTIITEPGNNLLRQLAEHYGITCLDHPTDIGGRFAALTVVGELPARIAGLDVDMLHQGAMQVYDSVINGEDTSLQAAAGMVALHKSGISQAVLMPYVDRLELFGEWYCQLWAESLGKQGKGTTPIRALGTVDQHSQLQLYLDGPKDKAFTLLLLENHSNDAVLPSMALGHPLCDLLRDKTMGDLLLAEQAATYTTLRQHNLPTRAFKLQHVDEQVMGGLMAHFIVETLATAHLWQINPFDQPAVEEGKILTRKYLENVA